MSNSSRTFRQVDKEKYYSPKTISKLVKKLCTYKTVYIDPCAGENALYDVIPNPKKRFDIQDGTDFFTTTRNTFGKQNITFVMNPPFSLPNQKNGVIAFVNHAATCMKVNEVIICVAPQTMRKWTNITKVSQCLHLLEEYVYKKQCVFDNNGKKKKVSIVIQIWKKQVAFRKEPIMLKKSNAFKTTFFYPGDFYIKVWGILRKLGEYTDEEPKKNGKKFQTKVGTLAFSGKSGTAMCIRVLGNKDFVKIKFQMMYERGDWAEYMKFKCAGNNNPVLTSSQIYTLYHKGLEYLQKHTYGVKEYFI